MKKWSELFSAPPSRLTVIGMAKNTGKTVTQNYLRKLAQADGRVIGLLSIGLDGEKNDAMTKLPKPAVWVEPGTIIATAEALLERPLLWECLHETGIATPVGKILILRARVKEQVVLAGPSKNSEVSRVLRCMEKYGAECVFIDGAFDRQSSADPVISDQVVLASGASLNNDLETLVSLTKCRVEQLTLSECEPRHAEMARQCRGRVSRVSVGVLETPDHATALMDGQEWDRILKDSEILFIRGAVGEGLGEALLRCGSPPQIVIRDGSKIFLSQGLWRRLRQKQVPFSVERRINLLGVTVNPACPGSLGLNPDRLIEAMGRALYPVPVMDAARELKYVRPVQGEVGVSGC